MPADALYTFTIYPILFILPAWVANATPVIFGGGSPLDFDKKLGGRPILGKHKTIRGTASGLLGGLMISALESLFLGYPIAPGAALATGAIAGDLLGSLIKRRANLKEGASVLGMDQYLFFIMALLFALPFGAFPTLIGLAFVTVLTGLMHRASNIVAHRLKMKQVPW